MTKENIRNVWIKKRYAAKTCLDRNLERSYQKKLLQFLTLSHIGRRNIFLKRIFLIVAAYYVIRKNQMIEDINAIHSPIERVIMICISCCDINQFFICNFE